MKGQVLFVHGGGEGAHAADGRLAASLREAMGDDLGVRYPKMPGEDAPEYGAWRGRISEELTRMSGEVILVGHSLGASILLKYLSEEEPEKPIAGVFLLAAPFWGAEDWEVEEYELRENFASKLPEGLPVSLYHGRDDEVVPLSTSRCTRRSSRTRPFASSAAADTNSATTSPISPGTSERYCRARGRNGRPRRRGRGGRDNPRRTHETDD